MRHIRRIVLLLLSLVLIPALAQRQAPVASSGLDPKDQAYFEELTRGMSDLVGIISFFCVNVYPQPTPKECLLRIKHGVGNSFDPHSAYLSEDETRQFREESSGVGFGGIGIEVIKPPGSAPLLVVSAIEGTPAEKAGLLADDLIVGISSNGRDFFSTTAMKNSDEAVKKIRGEIGTMVTLKVRRAGVEKELVVPIRREAIKIAQIKGELLRAGGKTYALIRNKKYGERNTLELKAKYKELERQSGGKLSGLILASEDNPGGLLDEVIAGVDLFIDTDSVVLDRDNKGISPHVAGSGILETRGDITSGLPMLVVVNAGCASACEVFAANMQFHHRALVASTRENTFGKGIVQTITRGPSGDALKYTSSEYLVGSMNNWIPVQCIGVKADVVFSYPNIKEQKRISECELSDHVPSKGPMENPPKFKSLKEVNPAHYSAGLEMLEVYKSHMLPKMQKDEERRKAMIESQKQE